MASGATVESFVSLEHAWQELLPLSYTDTPFVTPLWQRVWWERLGHGSELCLISVQDGRRVAGVAPLMRREGLVTFIGGKDLVDYHDFVVDPEAAPAFFEALAGQLSLAEWREVALESIPAGAPALRHLPPVLERLGMRVELEHEDVAPRVRLPDTWEQFLASLSRKDRHELRRKLRRLERAGRARHYALSEPREVSEAVPDWLRLMGESREEKAAFLSPEREGFLRAMARELAEAGLVRLYFLELGDARVAAALCLDYKGTRLLYNSGYQPADGRLAVGLLLKALCLKDAIEQGMGTFDFLRGPEPYKYDLGGEDLDLYTMRVRR